MRQDSHDPMFLDPIPPVTIPKPLPGSFLSPVTRENPWWTHKERPAGMIFVGNVILLDISDGVTPNRDGAFHGKTAYNATDGSIVPGMVPCFYPPCPELHYLLQCIGFNLGELSSEHKARLPELERKRREYYIRNRDRKGAHWNENDRPYFANANQ